MLQILGLRVALVVERQAARLVAEGVLVHEQAGLVRVGHQRGRCDGGRVLQVHLAVAIHVEHLAGRVEAALHRHEIGLPWADAVGIGLDLRQAGRCEHGRKLARVAGANPVVRARERRGVGVVDSAVLEVVVVAIDELHHARVQALAAHQLQAARLEALHEDRRGLAVPAGGVDEGDELVFERHAEVAVERRVLGFRVHADGAALGQALCLCQIDDLLQGHHLVQAVVLLRPLGQRLDRAQGLDLGEREVARPPVGGGGVAIERTGDLAGCEFGVAGNVGGDRKLRVVARDQHAVLGRDDIGLDHIGAQVDGLLIRLERFLGQVTRGAAVRDDERLRTVERRQRVVVVIPATGTGGERGAAGQCEGQSTPRGAGNFVHVVHVVDVLHGVCGSA